MAQRSAGGFRLFRLFGIDVSLHWSWFLIAYYDLQNRRGGYQSPVWNVAELIVLFGIVTLHEFGHALACRSVGGTANRILLWPLGGIAFVAPPQRPGAMLWSIAAGPLVNVILAPIFFLILHLAQPDRRSDLGEFLYAINVINLSLLIFNMLPIYPLDGGQILRSLLWFAVGPGKSLRIATVIGMLGAATGMALALYSGETYLTLVAAFAAWQCWIGFRYASALLEQEALTRRPTADKDVPRGT